MKISYAGFFLGILLISLPQAVSQDVTIPTPEPPPSATLPVDITQTPTTMPSDVFLQSATPWDAPTSADIPTIESSPATLEISPTAIYLIDPIPSSTDQATPENTLTVTLEPSVTLTQEDIISTLTDTPTPTWIITLTPEITTVTPLPTETIAPISPDLSSPVSIEGSAHYQSRETGDASILITVLDSTNTPIGLARTDVNGTYTVFVPANQPYTLIVAASLHRHTQLSLLPGELPPIVILLGGDLDQDGCIGESDIQILTGQFETNNTSTDINDDGVTGAADLAILASNYQAVCDSDLGNIDLTLQPQFTPTETMIISPTNIPTLEVTTPVLETPTQVEAEVSPEVTATLIPE